MSVDRRSIWSERLHSALTWHIAGTVILALLATWLGVRLAIDWTFADSSADHILSTKRAQLESLTTQIAPFRGLDKQVAIAREQIETFYTERIPGGYSVVTGRVGDLAIGSGVRLSGIQYSQGTPGIDLTEIAMDAGISGQYPQVMRFVNGLERDRIFFVIRAMSLTGQQAGGVALRLRVSTWLRPTDAEASGLPRMSTIARVRRNASGGEIN